MSHLNSKERLLKVLRKETVDRPPVICPGGMMNAAIVDVMQRSGYTLPEAHSDAALMAHLASAIQHYTGFENIGIPFCMTVEAEVLGSQVDYGTFTCEPKITKEIFPDCAHVIYKNHSEMLQSGRVQTIAQTARLLSEKHPDLPLIGNLTGPLSAAASLVDPIPFYKDLRKNPAAAHAVLEYVTDFLIAFAHLLIDHGVTLIAIADPSATGEILGPKMFKEYAVKYLNKLITGIHEYPTPSGQQTPVILHICGNMNAVKPLLPDLAANAISTDAIVNLRLLKEEFPEIVTMGNISTYLLEYGPAEKVSAQTKKLVADGINIIAPACGLSTSTALEHILALSNTVKSGGLSS